MAWSAFDLVNGCDGVLCAAWQLGAKRPQRQGLRLQAPLATYAIHTAAPLSTAWRLLIPLPASLSPHTSPGEGAEPVTHARDHS